MAFVARWYNQGFQQSKAFGNLDDAIAWLVGIEGDGVGACDANAIVDIHGATVMTRDSVLKEMWSQS